MSVFKPAAPQIWPPRRLLRKTQFRTRRYAGLLRMCRGKMLQRNDVTLTFAAILPKTGDRSMRRQRWDGPAILVTLFLCTASSPVVAAEPSPEVIAKGKALTEAGDCGSCHTADPAKPFAGGKRIATPFGGIYSAHLTPDRNTGIGLWSDEDFRRSMRFGVRPDGANYYPAFPYPRLRKLTRGEILAIRAYVAPLTHL